MQSPAAAAGGAPRPGERGRGRRRERGLGHRSGSGRKLRLAASLAALSDSGASEPLCAPHPAPDLQTHTPAELALPRAVWASSPPPPPLPQPSFRSGRSSLASPVLLMPASPCHRKTGKTKQKPNPNKLTQATHSACKRSDRDWGPLVSGPNV